MTKGAVPCIMILNHSKQLHLDIPYTAILFRTPIKFSTVHVIIMHNDNYNLWNSVIILVTTCNSSYKCLLWMK